jgi:hypothetical protein
MRFDHVQTIVVLIIFFLDLYGSSLASLIESLESLDVLVGFVVGLQWVVRHGLTVHVENHVVTVEMSKVEGIFGVISVSGSRRRETQVAVDRLYLSFLSNRFLSNRFLGAFLFLAVFFPL